MRVTAHAVTRHVGVAHTKVVSHPPVDLLAVARATTVLVRDRVITMTLPPHVAPAAVAMGLMRAATHATIALARALINLPHLVAVREWTLQNPASAVSDA